MDLIQKLEAIKTISTAKDIWRKDIEERYPGININRCMTNKVLEQIIKDINNIKL